MKKILLVLLLSFIALPAAACTVNEEWYAQKEAEFAKIDKNKDESLVYAEYKDSKKETGVPAYAIKQSWNSLTGGEDKLTKEQYIAAIMPKCAGTTVEETEIEE